MVCLSMNEDEAYLDIAKRFLESCELHIHHGINIHDIHVNFRAIAALVITLNSMRNKYLYPEERSTTFIKPEDQISMTDVRLMVRRVRGIIREIERLI